MIAILLAVSLQIAPNTPSFNVTGPGPFTNLGCTPVWSDRECDAAWTNALAHVWFGTACPLVGYYVGGSSGLRKYAATCAGIILVREIFFHGNAGGPEVRTDMISGLSPIIIIVAIDLIRSH